MVDIGSVTAIIQPAKIKKYFTFFPDIVKSQVEWYKCKLFTFIVNFDKRIRYHFMGTGKTY